MTCKKCGAKSESEMCFKHKPKKPLAKQSKGLKKSTLTAKPTARPMTPAPPRIVLISVVAPSKLNATTSPRTNATTRMSWVTISARKGLGITRRQSVVHFARKCPLNPITTKTPIARRTRGRARIHCLKFALN